MEAVVSLLEDALGDGPIQLLNELQLLLRYGYQTGQMDTADKVNLLFEQHQVRSMISVVLTIFWQCYGDHMDILYQYL